MQEVLVREFYYSTTLEVNNLSNGLYFYKIVGKVEVDHPQTFFQIECSNSPDKYRRVRWPSWRPAPYARMRAPTVPGIFSTDFF